LLATLQEPFLNQSDRESLIANWMKGFVMAASAATPADAKSNEKTQQWT